jgi:hypothetical protein
MDVQTLDNRAGGPTKTARPRRRRTDVARTSSRSRRWLAVFLPCSLLACGSLNVADFAAFLVPAVTVVIENDTSFTAIPVLSASDSRNGVEDVFATDDPLTHFGTNGAIAPHQTVTFRLPCESDLETLAFNSARPRPTSRYAGIETSTVETSSAFAWSERSSTSTPTSTWNGHRPTIRSRAYETKPMTSPASWKISSTEDHT